MTQLKYYWHIIQRGWWIIALTTAIAAVGAAVITASAPPVYQSYARYIVSPNSDMFEDSDLERRSLDTLDNSGILTTYAEVFSSNRMRQQGMEALGLTADEMEGYEVTAVNLPQTKIVELSVRGENPQQAMELANAIGRVSSTYMQGLYEIYAVSELDTASVPTNSLNVSPARNAVLAGILGFVVGVGLAFVYGYLRQEQESINIQADSAPA
jgi:capsular polysaccharide biosynthesis protein